MKRLLTSLAAFVLVAQTVLPNFLYATGDSSNGTEESSTPTETVQPTNPASGDDKQVVIDGDSVGGQLVVQPQDEDDEILADEKAEDEDDEIEIIIEDEFDFSALENDVEEESIEENKNADEDKSDIYIANKSLLKSNSISLQSISSFTCPASPTVDGIKSALIDGYEQHTTVQKYDLLNTVKGFSNGNVDVNALLPYLTDENFYYDLASLVEDFAADLTGSVTSCLQGFIETLGLAGNCSQAWSQCGIAKSGIKTYLDYVVSILTTPENDIERNYDLVNIGNKNFGLSVVLRKIGKSMEALQWNSTTSPSNALHQILEMLPTLSTLIEEINNVEFLLTNSEKQLLPVVDKIPSCAPNSCTTTTPDEPGKCATDIYKYGRYSLPSYTKEGNCEDALLGAIAYLDSIKNANLFTSQSATFGTALQGLITQLEDLDTNTFGELNALLTDNGIAGLTGIQDLLDDVQPALIHLEKFFAALEKGEYDTALTIAKTDLVNDIDNFKHHPMGQKVLRLVGPLADAAVDELVAKGWINSNAADQIKTAVEDLITKDTETIIKNLVGQLTITLNSNKIAAPTFENLSGTAPTSFVLPSTGKITLEMKEPADSADAWAYIAVVSLPDSTQQLFVLPGRDAQDWNFPVPTTGTYSIDIMTLGKTNIINGEKAWKWLSQFGWNEKRDSLSAKLLLRVNASALTQPQKDKLTALVGILGEAIEPLANSLLLQGQTIVKDRIIFANNTAGQRVEVNASGYLKADEVITLLKEMKTLAANGGTVGNFVGALLNPTHSYTLKVEPAPVTPPTGGSSGGGGGGGGSSLVQDNCPNGDNSGSYYDGTCGTSTSTGTVTTGSIAQGTIAQDIEDIILSGETATGSAKCSIAGSTYSEEENTAYLYACENDITTMRTIQAARMEDKLTRAEMAKIVVQYLIKIAPDKKPDLSKNCSAFSQSISTYPAEMQEYMTLSCQFDVMGVHPDYTPLSDFMPDNYVSRAEFGTIFSRILWGTANEGTDQYWYQNHLTALRNAGIITNTTPTMYELRAWVFLQLYRSWLVTQLQQLAGTANT